MELSENNHLKSMPLYSVSIRGPHETVILRGVVFHHCKENTDGGYLFSVSFFFENGETATYQYETHAEVEVIGRKPC